MYKITFHCVLLQRRKSSPWKGRFERRIFSTESREKSLKKPWQTRWCPRLSASEMVGPTRKVCSFKFLFPYFPFAFMIYDFKIRLSGIRNPVRHTEQWTLNMFCTYLTFWPLIGVFLTLRLRIIIIIFMKREILCGLVFYNICNFLSMLQKTHLHTMLIYRPHTHWLGSSIKLEKEYNRSPQMDNVFVKPLE